jgi:hypothetical protein
VVFAALILGLLWLLHRGAALEIILHVMCFLSLIYLLNAARLSGGVFSLRLLWLMVIPVMSYYVMGPRSGLVWMIVTGLSTATMGVLTLNGVGVEIPAINPQQHLYAFATISVNCARRQKRFRRTNKGNRTRTVKRFSRNSCSFAWVGVVSDFQRRFVG